MVESEILKFFLEAGPSGLIAVALVYVFRMMLVSYERQLEAIRQESIEDRKHHAEEVQSMLEKHDLIVQKLMTEFRAALADIERKIRD